MERRLAAILTADVAGYSRLMGADEGGTLDALQAHRRELIDPRAAKYNGRIIKLMGDGVLMEFTSVVDAVAFAVDVQLEMRQRNRDISENKAINFRVGINIGDIMVEDGDIYGDGVNVAARLEALSEPGGICISRNVRDEIRSKLSLTLRDQGEVEVKNIQRPVRVFHVVLDAKAEALPPSYQPAAARRNAAPWSKRATIIVALVAVAMMAGTAWWGVTRDRGTVSLPPGPRIAVLPFANAGGNPDDTAFGDSLAEDIGAALAKFTDVSVISGEATRRFEGANVDPQEAGRTLGAGYVLAGSLRRLQNELRVTARLLRTEDGSLLSSENYELSLTDANFLDMEGDVAGQLAGRIASPMTALWKAEAQKTAERLRREQTGSLIAYDCVLFSYSIYDDFSKEKHGQARDCLEKAVALVPGYAVAWAKLGGVYFEEHKYGHNLRPDPLGRARAAAQKSIELDPQIAEGYYVLALVHYFSEPEFDTFRTVAEKAISINPNNAWIIADVGVWTYYSGDWVRGEVIIQKAKKLYSVYPRWIDWPGVLDRYRKHEYIEAKAAAIEFNVPKNVMVQSTLAAIYGQLGEVEKAKRIIAEIRKIKPEYDANPRAEFQARRMPEELVESVMDGLRKAGLEVRQETR